MGLRDLVILLVVYGGIPFMLKKPFIGVLVWIWVSLMNPHKLAWALDNFQLAQIVAIVMLTSLLISRSEEKRMPWNTITYLLALWWGWLLVTTFSSMNPYSAWNQWSVVWKIMLTTFVIIMVLNSKERIISAAIMMMLSIGFFGFKGGFFTLISGGGYRVWGPVGTFLAGNNEVGLALIMIVPLVFFAGSLAPTRGSRAISFVGIVLCFVAVLGTQSRGAFVGAIAMGFLLAVRSPNRRSYMLIVLLLIPFAIIFMPETWSDRMASMADYKSDDSALGRINAWWMAFYLALDSPIVGGGFGAFTKLNFILYAPDPNRVHDAHSIYFEVLGEQGFVGLAIFLSLGIATLAKAESLRKQTVAIPELLWMHVLATMVQLSILGYAVCGLFLGLAYFDLYYMLVALVVGAGVVLDRTRAAHPEYFQLQPAKTSPASALARSLQSAELRSSPRRTESTFKWRDVLTFAKQWYGRL